MRFTLSESAKQRRDAGLPKIWALIGITSLFDPKKQRLQTRRCVEHLLSQFLYSLDKAERQEAAGEPATLVRQDAVAYALALRVLLHPDAQAIVEAESAKDIV